MLMCGEKTTQVLTLSSTLCVHQYVGESHFEAIGEAEDERIVVMTGTPSETVYVFCYPIVRFQGFVADNVRTKWRF